MYDVIPGSTHTYDLRRTLYDVYVKNRLPDHVAAASVELSQRKFLISAMLTALPESKLVGPKV